MRRREPDGDGALADRIANDTPFGLGSYVYTTDQAQAERVANALDAGMVWINLVLGDAAELPFGGTKRSGFGRELGRFAIEEFVNKKLIRTAGVTRCAACEGGALDGRPFAPTFRRPRGVGEGGGDSA